MGPSGRHLGPNFGPSWAHLGLLGASLGRLGAISSTSFHHHISLKPSGGHLDPFGFDLGPSWGHPGAVLGPSWGLPWPPSGLMGLPCSVLGPFFPQTLPQTAAQEPRNEGAAVDRRRRLQSAAPCLAGREQGVLDVSQEPPKRFLAPPVPAIFPDRDYCNFFLLRP